MATTTQTSSFRQLSDGNSIGTIFGISSTDVIGFYGVTTAVIKGTSVGAASTYATSQVSSATQTTFGFSSNSSATNLIAQVSSVIAQLTALGLIS